MSMEITIEYNHRDDYSFEEIVVTKDGKKIFEVSTQADFPEDNNIARMGIKKEVFNLIKTLVPNAEIKII